MPPKKKLKPSDIEPFIKAYSDVLNIRIKISDILNGIVNNNDIMDMIKNALCKIRKSANNTSRDENIIEKADTELLQETFEKPIHRFGLNTVKPTEAPINESVETSLPDSGVRNRCSSFNKNDMYNDKKIQDQINKLRYRESIFRAASRLTKELQPFPTWSYKEDPNNIVKTRKINVGGKIFEIFEDTCSNILNTKLSNCIRDHKFDETLFIDRDPVCFNAVLNFYRTGRLHTPPNICLTFFEDELLFWGISEEFLESCCWSEYHTFKSASNKLKVYSEDSERNQRFSSKHDNWTSKFRQSFYRIMTSGSNTKASRWVSLFCAASIIVGIFCMIIGTTPLGRTDKITKEMATFNPNESVSRFLERSTMNTNVANMEILISGYFCFELLSRMFLCPSKLEFFSDALNWVDIIATLTSVVGATPVITTQSGHLEAYILFLKLPRILRLFRLTDTLRSGIGAFTLTIKACIKELKLVFVILMITAITFAVLMFAFEIKGADVNIYNVYVGMWWATVSMGGVGFGDYYPKTTIGYIVGGFCIMFGVVICQMPVPIFLKNFSIYYNQASARLISQSRLLLFENVDKTDVRNIERNYIEQMEYDELNLKKGKLKRLLSKFK